MTTPSAARPLFATGKMVLHSGGESSWKIDCDVLTDADWRTLALMAQEVLPPYSRVHGIPTGGTRFATALNYYAVGGDAPVLIADDVLTTGASMEAARHGNEIGVVAFARGRVPSWVTPLFVVGTTIAQARAEGEQHHDCGICGQPYMVRNPHPDAGKLSTLLTVGAMWACVPCTFKALHTASTKRYEAEQEAARLREVLRQVAEADCNHDAIDHDCGPEIARAALAAQPASKERE